MNPETTPQPPTAEQDNTPPETDELMEGIKEGLEVDTTQTSFEDDEVPEKSPEKDAEDNATGVETKEQDQNKEKDKEKEQEKPAETDQIIEDRNEKGEVVRRYSLREIKNMQSEISRQQSARAELARQTEAMKNVLELISRTDPDTYNRLMSLTNFDESVIAELDPDAQVEMRLAKKEYERSQKEQQDKERKQVQNFAEMVSKEWDEMKSHLQLYPDAEELSADMANLIVRHGIGPKQAYRILKGGEVQSTMETAIQKAVKETEERMQKQFEAEKVEIAKVYDSESRQSGTFSRGKKINPPKKPEPTEASTPESIMEEELAKVNLFS